MNSMMAFIGLLLLGAAGAAFYSMRKYGRVRNWQHWVIAGAAVLAALLGMAVVNSAKAQELDLFAYTEVYAGIEGPFVWETVPHCARGDDTLIVNTGFNQNLVQIMTGNTETSVNTGYRHNSCVVGDDREVADNLGLTATFRMNW